MSALQGAFLEHQQTLQKLSAKTRIKVVQVRTPDDLVLCEALIIPGGGTFTQVVLHMADNLNRITESTTIALLARSSGLFEPLREFVRTKVVWGTCAGAILLSKTVSNAKEGGQELLSGISVNIARNHWGTSKLNGP